ncbi:hypothetical protein Atai01_06080 [Amycolatopsis taiwanensis]|uniref:Uncharacterized protein n=1 Tax=Amycolatopsis taiwanensis TaxID=342230 RepID=A0A9W6QUV1_9PSEU|nr:hypothetical protein Atai01_06080 [Amycolatopsis taiwanensis]
MVADHDSTGLGSVRNSHNGWSQNVVQSGYIGQVTVNEPAKAEARGKSWLLPTTGGLLMLAIAVLIFRDTLFAKPGRRPITSVELISVGPEVTHGLPCEPTRLCAYRGVPGHSARFDLPAPNDGNSEFGVCHTLPPEDPGFQAVYNARNYSYYFYPLPNCAGEPQLVRAGWMGPYILQFRSLEKA